MIPTRIDLISMRHLSVARAVIVAAALSCASTPVAGQVASSSCGVSAPESRWLAESYRETHSYGLARISHTVTAEGFGGSVGAEFLPREQVEREQAALRPCFRGVRGAGTAA